MDKNQFIDRHRNLMIQQQELERKWRMYVREQEELALMAEAAEAQAAFNKATINTGAVGGFYTNDLSENLYVVDDYIDNYLD